MDVPDGVGGLPNMKGITRERCLWWGRPLRIVGGVHDEALVRNTGWEFGRSLRGQLHLAYYCLEVSMPIDPLFHKI